MDLGDWNQFTRRISTYCTIVLFKVLKWALNIEIVVQFWIFVFFLIFSWKKSDLKELLITLVDHWSYISFELRHLNSLKVSQILKLCCSFFLSWKLRENKDSKFVKNFNIRCQFQHFEYDMILALEKNNMANLDNYSIKILSLKWLKFYLSIKHNAN